MTHFKYVLFVSLFVLANVFFPTPSSASDYDTARHIATLLGEEFNPEYISVTVKDSRAYAEMRGSVMSGIRIEMMRLDALITGSTEALSGDVDSLADLIGYSKGEIVMLEKDVNDYFAKNDTAGFSNLSFDFTKDGFRANGILSLQMLFTINIRLAATGKLALVSDGVILDDVAIYAENFKQPDILTNEVTKRVNPLISWSSIPFKVEFKEVTMDDTSAKMTGYPEEMTGDSFTWHREDAMPAGSQE